MDYRYYVCPSITGRHEGWLVDGKRIRLTFPAMFPEGFKLMVAFGYKPTKVHAIITTFSSDNHFATHYQPATYEEPCSLSK